MIEIEWLPFQRARSCISAPCFFSILKALPESRSSIGAKTPVVRRGLVVYDLAQAPPRRDPDRTLPSADAPPCPRSRSCRHEVLGYGSRQALYCQSVFCLIRRWLILPHRQQSVSIRQSRIMFLMTMPSSQWSRPPTPTILRPSPLELMS